MPKQSSDKIVDQQPPFPYGKTYSQKKKVCMQKTQNIQKNYKCLNVAARSEATLKYSVSAADFLLI